MPMNMGYTLASIILGGVLDRHPEAQVVMAESGIGWVPYLLDPDGLRVGGLLRPVEGPDPQLA